MLATEHKAVSSRQEPYIAEQINSMSPMELLIKLYDIGITSCAQKDKERLSRTIVELIAALDFEHRQIAVGLYRIYNYCLRQARMDQFDQVKPLLVELRDTWRQVQIKEDDVAKSA